MWMWCWAFQQGRDSAHPHSEQASEIRALKPDLPVLAQLQYLMIVSSVFIFLVSLFNDKNRQNI